MNKKSHGFVISNYIKLNTGFYSNQIIYHTPMDALLQMT